MTIGTVAAGDLASSDGYSAVDVDLDDNGWVYLKQDDDWVCIPISKIGDLVKILETVHS